MKRFDELKIEYDLLHKTDKEVSCFFASSYDYWENRKIIV